MTHLSTRPQNQQRTEKIGSSTFNPNGTLRIKTANGWVTYPRYVAEKYAEKLGQSLPKTCRIYSLDPNVIAAKTLNIKIRGQKSQPLVTYLA